MSDNPTVSSDTAGFRVFGWNKLIPLSHRVTGIPFLTSIRFCLGSTKFNPTWPKYKIIIFSKLVILLFYYLRTLNLLFHRSLWLQSTRIGFPGYEVGLWWWLFLLDKRRQCWFNDQNVLSMSPGVERKDDEPNIKTSKSRIQSTFISKSQTYELHFSNQKDKAQLQEKLS